ncbi:MAG: phosphatidate cytidylyltransferase [Gammaproteobacteria bacterium]|nr:phosphatidate cytidylyltransferase [Gammaproteobacteria bacterium]
MLKKRLITAAILVPLVLFAILYANYWVLLGLLAFVFGLASDEWGNLTPVSSLRERAIFLIVLFLGVVVCFAWFKIWLVLGLVLWCLMFLAVITYPTSQRIWGFSWCVALLAMVFLPLASVSAIGLYQQPHGPGLIVYVLALVGVSDSGAYFVGNFLGKHALIPHVSSGKTIEGALGGLILPMGVASVGAWIWSPGAYLSWFGLALVTVVVSMFGDLLISMLKRRRHLKDTGSLLPGHGGVLDRLDSLLAALPWFYVGLYYLFPGF